MKKMLYLLIFCGMFSYGQETLRLKVEDKTYKQPLAGAVIHFLGKHYITDNQGNAIIHHLKTGTYSLKVTHLGYEDYQTQITVPTSVSPWSVQLSESVNQLSEIVIASENRTVTRSTVTQILDKKQLQKQSGEVLAKMLASLQGVSMIQTGATIAKPVIHGLHSNRILILNNEVRQEGQQWGADHAPEIDPSMATRITVIKGADAVRYGSDALGGVILLSPNKLPYGDTLHGEVSPSFASNGRKTATFVKLESAVPNIPQWAWCVQGATKRAGDIKTGDYLLNNTGVQEFNFSIATGFEQEKWGVEVFYSQYNNEAGVFYGSHIGNLDDLRLRFEIGRPITTYPFSYQINAPKQKVLHHLAKAKGFVHLPFGGKITAQYAYQEDIRQEYNVRRLDRSSIPTLDMNLSTHSLDVSWENSYQRWKSQLGGSFSQQVNYNEPGTGVVPVIPNFASVSYGVFGVQKYYGEHWEAEVGLRYDYKNLNADGYDSYSQRYRGDHTFHNLTYLLGGSYRPHNRWGVTSNLGVAWRAPHVNELYSNGLHHGAGTYDIGDSSLKAETGVKWITSVKYEAKKFAVNADLFVQVIKNYIYDTPTGEVRTLFSGAYPIFRYQQADAFFRGGDLELSYVFLPKLTYKIRASVVYANELKTNSYFPFIPSERVSQELLFELPKWGKWRSVYISAKHQFIAKQTRFDPAQELVGETPDTYHLFDAGIGTTLLVGRQSLAVHLSAENVLNKLYKEYTNRFRYYAHDTGRNIQLRLTYSF